MKVKFSRRYILLVAFILVLAAIYSGGLAMAKSYQEAFEQKTLADSTRINRKIGQQIMERSLLYRNIGARSTIDFQLKSTGRSQFELTFENPFQHPVRIRIYNIIGNLITVEEAPAGRSFTKTYNFSNDKMRLFVVEVGNSKHNLTKKITTI